MGRGLAWLLAHARVCQAMDGGLDLGLLALGLDERVEVLSARGALSVANSAWAGERLYGGLVFRREVLEAFHHLGFES